MSNAWDSIDWEDAASSPVYYKLFITDNEGLVPTCRQGFDECDYDQTKTIPRKFDSELEAEGFIYRLEKMFKEDWASFRIAEEMELSLSELERDGFVRRVRKALGF